MRGARETSNLTGYMAGRRDSRHSRHFAKRGIARFQHIARVTQHHRGGKGDFFMASAAFRSLEGSLEVKMRVVVFGSRNLAEVAQKKLP